MEFISKNTNQYELIDFGRGQRLERFGKIVMIRPDVQANGDRSLSKKDWEKRAHLEFIEGKKQSGEWKFLKDVESKWTIDIPVSNEKLTFNLELTKFKHVGIFQEQMNNWDFIYDSIKKTNRFDAKVLNLFAYTGGASLAARLAGAHVTHVDSIKQVNEWGRRNMLSSGLEDIRWIVDDALKFAQKEVRRGNKYNGIIMDPPSWGRGPKGEIWKVENLIEDLVKTCSELADDNFFMVLNTYSGLDSLTMKNLISNYFPNRKVESGILYLLSTSGKLLPTGMLNRIIN